MGSFCREATPRQGDKFPATSAESERPHTVCVDVRFDGTPSRAGRLAIIALLALGVFVTSVRPIVRPQGDLYRARGMGRWGLLGEPAGDDDASPAVAVAEPESVVSLLPTALPPLFERRTEQPVNPPLRLRHRTLPPPRAGDSPSA
jgi:hypothetical protein